ncbi:hypothetical protein Tco_0111927 [Tanacetum coccineum]
MGYFQIIRADGSLRRPEESYERVLWGDLKVMFKPDVESEEWRNLQGYNVTVWKLFSLSGCIIVSSASYIVSTGRRIIIVSTDHNLWDVIVNGDLEEEPAPTTRETSAPPAPKTAKQLAARRNQERVKCILLLAILDEYLIKFQNVADAKSL